MKTLIRKASLSTLGALLLIAGTTAAQAQVRITEVAPWSSGNSPVGADWIELTNTGSSAVSISGWKMDDDSASFSSAVALSGITSIGAGESVIFIEGSGTALVNSFISNWFGGSAPAGLQIGTYSGSGVGLGAGGDQVNIFNSSGVLQASIKVGASDSSAPFHTFDNSAGTTGTGTTFTTLSVVGTNGAFLTASGNEVGSPGTVAAAVVPEPSSYALLLGGLAAVGLIARRRSGQQG
ncbi:lamin tail domain-containing protein [Burkholderiaceae bacterium UC74_6]